MVAYVNGYTSLTQGLAVAAHLLHSGRCETFDTGRSITHMVCVSVPYAKAKTVLLSSTGSASGRPGAKAWMMPVWVTTSVEAAKMLQERLT
mmetsp:Transcript_40702/g.80159  ORF Transcript_40702/g.80159 Transcript_40702/m.80159 type:complete len:91 (-) Transcript_40702:154-426(-)